MSENSGSSDYIQSLRAAWASAKPTRHYFAIVVNELNAAKLCGEASIFERGAHVPNTHMAYFKTPTDAFLVEAKSKDQRSAKEWYYINSVLVWLETDLTAVLLARTDPEPPGKLVVNWTSPTKLSMPLLSFCLFGHKTFETSPNTGSRRLVKWPF